MDSYNTLHRGSTKSPPGLMIHQKDSQDSVVKLIIMIYYSKRMKSTISKGKRHMECSLEETRCELPKVLSQWICTGCVYFPQQQVVTILVQCLPGKLIRNLVPKVFTGSRSQRQPLSSMNPCIQIARKKAGVQHCNFMLTDWATTPRYLVKHYSGCFRECVFG